jgi:hypothetical protein
MTFQNNSPFLVLLFVSLYVSAQTTVSISGNMFHIDGMPTYQGRYWKEHKIEGLLFNSRMVQGIFDDLNENTRERFKYPDTKEWSAERNTEEFVQAMEEWKKHGLLAFTLNLQGGSPMGYGNEGWVNSTFDEKGNLRLAYLKRLEQILDKANELKMVVILGYFYFGQDQHLENEEAVKKAVDNITDWILERSYKNILIEVNNECNVRYDHAILQPQRVHELIERIKGKSQKNHRLLVGTSYGGGTIPKSNVVQVSDFILLHGNGVKEPSKIEKMVADTKMVKGYTDQPILFNEDDHFNFNEEENNFVAAIKSNASWGYFDFRMKNEGYESGFQSVPVDWGINSDRKKSFFSLLKEITGY